MFKESQRDQHSVFGREPATFIHYPIQKQSPLLEIFISGIYSFAFKQSALDHVNCYLIFLSALKWQNYWSERKLLQVQRGLLVLSLIGGGFKVY